MTRPNNYFQIETDLDSDILEFINPYTNNALISDMNTEAIPFVYFNSNGSIDIADSFKDTFKISFCTLLRSFDESSEPELKELIIAYFKQTDYCVNEILNVPESDYPETLETMIEYLYKDNINGINYKNKLKLENYNSDFDFLVSFIWYVAETYNRCIDELLYELFVIIENEYFVCDVRSEVYISMFLLKKENTTIYSEASDYGISEEDIID